MRIAGRMRKIEASRIRKVFDLAATLKNPVNLSIGQPDFDVPEPVKDAAVKAIREGRNGYTPSPGLPALRERVSAWFSDKGIQHEAVMVTAGASGGLTLSLMALTEPGTEVLIPDPFFISYKHLVNAAGATPVYYDTYPDFIPDPEQIAGLITGNTTALILNSPNNPTGALYVEETVRQIVEAAAEREVAVISDECYDAFWYDTPPCSPGGMYPGTVTLNALSKLSAMTGWRLGFAAGPREIIDEMIKLQQFTFVCAPQPAQWAALEAFDLDFEQHRKDYRAKRDRLYNGIRDHFNVKKASGAFYLFPEVPVEGVSGEEFCLTATERNLLSVPGGAFSNRDRHLRLSFAAPDEVIEKGAEILRSLVEEMKNA